MRPRRAEWEFSRGSRKRRWHPARREQRLRERATTHSTDACLAGIPKAASDSSTAGQRSRHHLLDTHDAPVGDAVWELYRSALRRFGQVPALIEWDDQVPELERVVEESGRARAIEVEVLG
jgi:uncharacterized protein (UPF0276 family)